MENEAKREATFEEEYEILKKEKEELFAMEVCDTEPPFANCVVRRALRCIRKLLEEKQQYNEIGTIEELKTLKEKNMAKKQGNINDFDSHLRLSKAGFLCCSSTNKEIRYPLISLRDLEYCPRCGQALDWE